MVVDMLERERQRSGFSVAQAARRLGPSPTGYRDLLAGHSPPFDTWQATCDLYGWPQTIALSVTPRVSR